jgi:hypothetical protein
VHPRVPRSHDRDEANSDGLVDLPRREFVSDEAEPIMVYRYYLHRKWGGWAYLAAIID